MWCRNLLHHFMLHRSNLLKRKQFLYINRTMSTNIKSLEEVRQVLKDIFKAGVKAVSPEDLIKNKVTFKDRTLSIDGQNFELNENVYLVGFGKAVMGMAIVLEHMLGNVLKRGIVSIPSEMKEVLWDFRDDATFPKLGTGVIDYREGSKNNQPDDRSFETTHDIIDLVESLNENDTLIVLISGGGSALLYMPRPIIDSEDKMHLCKTLQNAGANIQDLNIVRQKLSMVKGGGLARMAFPASVITMMLSDIVGDPIDLIASGPTVYCRKRPEEVVKILKKYDLFGSIEGDVKKILTSRETFDDSLLLTRERQFKHVSNIILGNNTVAIEAASHEAIRKKLTPIMLRNDITGDVHDVSLAYVHVTNLICLALDKTLEREEFFAQVKEIPILPLSGNKVDEIYNAIENISGEGLVLIGGGEPTVTVKGEGKGGRNQELALHFSLDWLAKIKSCPRLAEYDVIMLSIGTDGQDGPTDAAGAFGYPALGPLIHDIHAKIKVLSAKEITAAEASKETDKRECEEIKVICKTQELSGYLSSKTVEVDQSPDVIGTGDTDSNAESVDDTEYVHPLIYQTMEVERMLPENTLAENDTYNFYSRFKRGVDLVKTGLTGTNVMDLHFIYIRKRKCDCKINYTEDDKSENSLDSHDLYIDPATIEKYRRRGAPLTFMWDRVSYKPVYTVDEADRLNIKIIDDNLADPCCRKDRKFPPKDLLKDKNLPL